MLPMAKGEIWLRLFRMKFATKKEFLMNSSNIIVVIGVKSLKVVEMLLAKHQQLIIVCYEKAVYLSNIQ